MYTIHSQNDNRKQLTTLNPCIFKSKNNKNTLNTKKSTKSAKNILLGQIMNRKKSLNKHYNMEGTSKTLDIPEGVKQGCVLVPLLFGILFAPILKHSFSTAKRNGIYLQSRSTNRLCGNPHPSLQGLQCNCRPEQADGFRLEDCRKHKASSTIIDNLDS